MVVFQIFFLIFTYYCGKFHHALGVGCQKELGEQLFKQERLISTIHYDVNFIFGLIVLL